MKYVGLLLHAVDPNGNNVGSFENLENDLDFWLPPDCPKAVLHKTATPKPYHVRIFFRAPPKPFNSKITFRCLIKRGPANEGEFYYPNDIGPLTMSATQTNKASIKVGSFGQSCTDVCKKTNDVCTSSDTISSAVQLSESVKSEFGCPSPVTNDCSALGMGYQRGNADFCFYHDDVCAGKQALKGRKAFSCAASDPNVKRFCQCGLRTPTQTATTKMFVTKVYQRQALSVAGRIGPQPVLLWVWAINRVLPTGSYVRIPQNVDGSTLKITIGLKIKVQFFTLTVKVLLANTSSYSCLGSVVFWMVLWRYIAINPSRLKKARRLPVRLWYATVCKHDAPPRLCQSISLRRTQKTRSSTRLVSSVCLRSNGLPPQSPSKPLAGNGTTSVCPARTTKKTRSTMTTFRISQHRSGTWVINVPIVIRKFEIIFLYFCNVCGCNLIRLCVCVVCVRVYMCVNFNTVLPYILNIIVCVCVWILIPYIYY